MRKNVVRISATHLHPRVNSGHILPKGYLSVTYIPFLRVGVALIKLYCALKKCSLFMPVLPLWSVTRRYCPVEYTGYGREVPQNLPRRGEELLDKKMSFIQKHQVMDT